MTYGTVVSGFAFLGYASSRPLAPTITTWGPRLDPIVIRLGLLRVRISVARIGAASQHVHEADLILGRFFFVQPSFYPLHCISVGTHRVRAGCVRVVCHTGELVGALAHYPNFSIRADVDNLSPLSDCFG